MSSEILGFKTKAPEKDSAGLRFLYGTFPGRCILRILRAKWVSALAGAFLDTALSKPLIKPFIKNNGINTDDYLDEDYTCFNDFFSRRIKPENRPVEASPQALIAPCDGLLSVYRVKSGDVYPVKQSAYTVRTLLGDRELADNFENGYMFVFRLCVNHYHRYCYPADGSKGKNVHIKGVFNTVRPVALYKRPVFCENSREYTVIDTEAFGRIVQMEVGAMLVGKIDNFHAEKEVAKGEEKGRFLYGGSTVILLCEKDAVKPINSLLESTENGLETPVNQGERINEI